jgi:glycosyltransferase 2 family protein
MEFLAKGYTAWKAMRSRPWWRVIQVGVVAACFCLMLYVLATNWAKVDFSSFRFNPVRFLAALAAGCVPVWLGALAWAEAVQAFCPDISYMDAIKFHLLSMPMKYLPGGALNQVNKAVQLSRAGVKTKLIVILIGLDVGLIIFTGITVIAQILMVMPQKIGFLSPAALTGLAVLLGGICLGLPVVLFELFKSERHASVTRKWFMIHFWRVELLDFVGWLSLGVTLWLVVGSVLPSTALALLPYIILTVAASLIVSLVVVFAPNGMGVREATMFMLLAFFVPAPTALAASVISRVVFVASELVSFLPLLLASLLMKSHKLWPDIIQKK